ncbi:MAG: hypothetical protein AAFV80_05780 [Bacteroidota bacterium]
MKRIHVIWSMLLFTCLGGQAQNVSVDLDSAQIMIGDQVRLNLTASFPVGSEVFFPNIEAENLGKIEILDISEIDTIKTDPEILAQQRILISAYDSGYLEIPGLLFTFVLPDGRRFNELSENLVLEVYVPQVDTTAQIAPIKSIMKEPFKLIDAVPFLALFGGIMAVILLGLFVFQRLTAKPVEIEEPPIVIPPYVTAYRKLDQLKEDKLWQKGEIKTYQSRLTFILREYIGGQYQFNALESTTEEILNQLREVAISGDWKIRLRELLQIADLVKFAKAKPGADFHEKALEDAYRFVDETRKLAQSTKEESAEAEEVNPYDEVETQKPDETDV